MKYLLGSLFIAALIFLNFIGIKFIINGGVVRNKEFAKRTKGEGK